MLKSAYQLGIKLALRDAGLLHPAGFNEDEQPLNPAGVLAAMLQKIPDSVRAGAVGNRKQIDDNYPGVKNNISSAFDTLNNTNLELPR